MRLLFVLALLGVMTHVVQAFRPLSRTGSFTKRVRKSISQTSRSMVLQMDDSETITNSGDSPTPGNPFITKMDKENSVAEMEITLSADATQKSFTKACELFNDEVKQRGYTAAGFRKGAKLPPAYLYQIVHITVLPRNTALIPVKN